jgi:hypothetical protein
MESRLTYLATRAGMRVRSFKTVSSIGIICCFSVLSAFSLPSENVSFPWKSKHHKAHSPGCVLSHRERDWHLEGSMRRAIGLRNYHVPHIQCGGTLMIWLIEWRDFSPGIHISLHRSLWSCSTGSSGYMPPHMDAFQIAELRENAESTNAESTNASRVTFRGICWARKEIFL